MEEWKAVVGYEGWYEVSSLGRVRRIRGGKGTEGIGYILSPGVSTANRLQVVLSRHSKQKTLPVHVLVAYAFIGPRPAGMHINHIDFDCRNNRADNLEYCTPLENARHAYANGQAERTTMRGSNNGNAKITEADAVAIRYSAIPRDKIAAIYGVSACTVKFIRNRRHWKHVA